MTLRRTMKAFSRTLEHESLKNVPDASLKEIGHLMFKDENLTARGGGGFMFNFYPNHNTIDLFSTHFHISGGE